MSTFILSLFFTSIMIISADAQTRRTSRSAPDRNAVESNDQGAWLGMSIGNIGYNRGFVFSGKASFGYDINKIVGVGINAKFFFDNLNLPGDDINLFSFGGGAFARISVTDEFFLQAEYSRTKFETQADQFSNITYPLVGGGYKSGFGNWTYGLQVLISTKDLPVNAPELEYWIDFNYKF